MRRYKTPRVQYQCSKTTRPDDPEVEAFEGLAVGGGLAGLAFPRAAFDVVAAALRPPPLTRVLPAMSLAAISEPFFKLQKNGPKKLNSQTSSWLGPTMSNNDHETPYSSYRQKAKDAFNNAKFEKALKLYAKAIKKHRPKIDPNNLEEVYVNRAICYLGLFKYEEAVIEADLAIKCNQYFSKVRCR